MPTRPTLHTLCALISLSVGLAWGDDLPSYQDGVLIIPSVNTGSQVGQYQDAVMQMNGQGMWQLNSVKSLGSEEPFALYLAPVSTVEVIKTEGVPVQVFLRVSGGFSSGCGSLGKVSQRLVGKQFELTLSDAFSAYSVALCTAAIMPYIKTIPLAVYGLSAGTYSYTINGKTGSFVLTADNVVPGDYFGARPTNPQY